MQPLWSAESGEHVGPVSYLMPPLFWGMLLLFWGALDCWAGAKSPVCCPAGLVCPLSCPFAALFRPIIGAGFAVLAVAIFFSTPWLAIFLTVWKMYICPTVPMFCLMHPCETKRKIWRKKKNFFAIFNFLRMYCIHNLTFRPLEKKKSMH